jgi:coproporphyrinogen III oxidase
MQTINRNIIAEEFRNIQEEICHGLEESDGLGQFTRDSWERPGGGGGVTRIFQYGNAIEKGGVNFSGGYGEAPENLLRNLKLKKGDFFATGISIVLHPYNPFVPIIHMNVRYFEMSTGAWWFGGGIDLTPHYIDIEEARLFHKKLQSICTSCHAGFYPKFKTWADEYFYIRHRNETRGVGGIFFDRLDDTSGVEKPQLFQFVCALARSFVPIYRPLLDRNRDKPYHEGQKLWQKIRRGRYVEFNLVYDKGTKFGLETGGRTESIFMSLPPEACWEYAHACVPGSAEDRTEKLLKKGIEWTNIQDARTA